MSFLMWSWLRGGGVVFTLEEQGSGPAKIAYERFRKLATYLAASSTFHYKYSDALSNTVHKFSVMAFLTTPHAFTI